MIVAKVKVDVVFLVGNTLRTPPRNKTIISTFLFGEKYKVLDLKYELINRRK